MTSEDKKRRSKACIICKLDTGELNIPCITIINIRMNSYSNGPMDPINKMALRSVHLIRRYLLNIKTLTKFF